jgi:hypothetical protein
MSIFFSPACLGPYNASYKHMRHHLLMAGLDALLKAKSDGSGAVANHWAVLCDVALCIETVQGQGSPTGYAIDAIDEVQKPTRKCIITYALLTDCVLP